LQLSTSYYNSKGIKTPTEKLLETNSIKSVTCSQNDVRVGEINGITHVLYTAKIST